MLQAQLAQFNRLRCFGSLSTRNTAKDDDIQQAVAHQTVSTVNTANSFTGNKQSRQLGLCILVNKNTAILVMQRRIDQNRFLAQVNAKLSIHAQHTRNAFGNSAFAMQHFNQRRIEPQRYTIERLHTLAAGSTLADDGRSCHITSFQRMHKDFAFAVYELRTNRAHLFGNQRTINLRRISNTRRMILNCIRINQRCTGTISHNKAVGSSTIMVRSREALIMQASCTTGCHDYAFCAYNLVLLRIKIPQHRTGSFALFVQQQLNCG